MPDIEDPFLNSPEDRAPSSLDLCSNMVSQPSTGKIPVALKDTDTGAEVDKRLQKGLKADPRGLRDRITNILEKNPIGLNPEGQYVPDGELEDLFKKDVVQSALGGDVDHTLADFVLQKAKKTFATLLLVFSDCESRQKAMEAFRTASFTDEKMFSTALDMPLATLELCETSPCKRGGGTCLHPFPFHDPWGLADLKDFKSKRWHFLVPTLDHNVFQYELDSHQLLPFTKKVALADLNNGNFSEVTCVKMLASKQTKILTSDETIIVALKTLKRINEVQYDIEKEWRREAKAHQQLNGKRDHIIQAIAAYRQIAADRQNDAYHLVLEWADGGNLLTFWKKNPEPQVDDDIERSRKRVMLVLKQLSGLVDALEGMHSVPAKSPGRSECNSPRPPNLSPERDVVRGAASPEMPSLSSNESPLPVFSLDGPNDPREDEGGGPSLIVSPPESSEQNPNDVGLLERVNSQMGSENWRHGDIKPENILRFIGSMEDAWIGTLKLADLGRARQHLLRTVLRETKEKELWRTRWYEPPDLAEEVQQQAQGKISRLFDIWSMGCVIFEIALWLLYGVNSIDDFLSANGLAPNEQFATPYWRKIGHGKYEVSETASKWMNHILQHDPERNGAIGHLIQLVRDRTLKVTLPPNSERYSEGCRTNAVDLKDQFKRIIAHAETDEKYLFTGHDRSNVITPQMGEPSPKQPSQPGSRSFLAPEDAEDRGALVVRGPATTIAQQRVYTNTIEDQWKASYDDDFVKSRIRDRQLLSIKSELCQACNEIDILSSQISFASETLKSNARDEKCDLCELVYQVVKDVEIQDSENIMMTRAADCFVLGGAEKKVLRLCRIDANATQDVKDIPLGAPTLPTIANNNPYAESLDAFIKLPKAWLLECDTKHGNKCAPRQGDRQLPKRLISVQNSRKPKIIEPEELKMDPQTVHYIAFSHKWGKMPAHAVTTKQNLQQRKQRIPSGESPLSFKNAVAITRALGRDFLWIDSLCINQGPDGDFAEQADTMQTTFSGAYCVIAACSAENATDGFLQEREPRCVKMGDVFVSAVTNDFERDVLQSTLHRRGWVLQERALARRTIFFTKNQAYWECGDGVRCETLMKLRNNETAFLGDPNFPSYTIRPKSSRGEQIHLFTKLFQRYSQLELSHAEDRPVAIDGIMERLTSAFRTQSLAGLFKNFWGRCLLWQRAEGARPLKKIPLGTHTKRTPPSWSWMAFEGAISFLEPEGGEFDWNERGVELPFARPQSSWLKTSHLRDSNAIHAQAFEFAHAENSTTGEAYLSSDNDNALSTTAAKCVVIGSEKEHAKDPDRRKHYVVFVSQTTGALSYERVGVGYVPGKFIKFAHPVNISIE